MILGFHSQLCHKIRQAFIGIFSRGKFLKSPDHYFRLKGMRLDSTSFKIINVSERGFCRPFAAPDFLTKTPINVFGKIICIVFALTKRHLQHKQTLRCWFKPKSGKAQGNNLFGIYKINYFSAINGITGKPVGVPSENSNTVTFFYFIHQFAKFYSAWLLSAFRFS
ncbi:MAG: hypothetical protein M1383_05355 [Patescibacteria group bacterium]|nr:hypothetical protein [Patescibacteria group bacterium]